MGAKCKIALALQTEVYQTGVIRILEPDYEILEIDPRLFQSGIVEQGIVDLIIIGFNEHGLQVNRNITRSIQNTNVNKAAILFCTDPWVISKALDLAPNVLLHYTASVPVMKEAISKALIGERFVDNQLAESLFSFSLRKDTSKTDNLTKQEKKVLGFLLQHLSNKEIAQELCLSERTIKFHCHNIYQKMGACNRTELIKLLGDVKGSM